MVTTGTVPAPGTDLHYVMQGTGPLLFAMDGAGGDARRIPGLVDRLTDSYTVVTYDRRGMSRSPAGDPMPDLTPRTHADDLALLLKSLADEPALVFGTSLGAQVGLHLLARHPQLVDTLVAHEPSEFLFLTEEERAEAGQVVLTAYETYKKEGFGAAMSRWAAFNDIDYGNLEFEPGAQLSPMTDEQLANIDFFITHEMPAYSTVQLDEPGLDVVRAERGRLVLATGTASERNWSYRCTHGLADRIGLPVEEFPGGHVGLKTHPTAFATRLREVLRARGH
ncbi:alpha/beta fold hydrolase [Streptomyces sp. NPDC087218]|uniref:alpha/beta fold hydrolase n=1 Tax=Streptomyces sp. NPDC087218 TaxID=3365769 RepID=UPI003816E756